MSTLREVLSVRLRTAMRHRDHVAVRSLRLALGALDNAGAVPIDVRAGAVESAAVGVGARDVERRVLSHADERAVVEAERQDLVDAGDGPGAAVLAEVLATGQEDGSAVASR